MDSMHSSDDDRESGNNGRTGLLAVDPRRIYKSEAFDDASQQELVR